MLFPREPPIGADVNGEWEGTWEGGTIGAGVIRLSLRHEGYRVSGHLAMSGAPAISATDGPIEGVLTDSVFSFSQQGGGGVMEGHLRVEGDQMVGAATGRLRAVLSLRRQIRP
jgi:hypothetical protein